MATAKELREQADRLQRVAHTAMADRALAAEAAERAAAEAARHSEHYNLMFTEIGQPYAGLNEAQHGAVYALAYQHGHSAGEAEVEHYYGEFAELARKVLEAR